MRDANRPALQPVTRVRSTRAPYPEGVHLTKTDSSKIGIYDPYRVPLVIVMHISINNPSNGDKDNRVNMASGVTGSLALVINLTSELRVRSIGALSPQSNFLWSVRTVIGMVHRLLQIVDIAKTWISVNTKNLNETECKWTESGYMRGE